MNINESLRDWINEKSGVFPSLAGVELKTQGEEGDENPPFVGIYESGVQEVEQNGVVLYGVSAFEITAELHDVPAPEEGETPDDAEAIAARKLLFQQRRKDLYDILGNRDAIGWISERNFWRVFDIRMSAPIMESSDGRLISRWIMTVIACPI